jgi:hypothetical protein
LSGIIQKLAVVLLLSTTSVIAQVARPAEPRTVSQVMDFWVTNTEQLLVPAAEIMPEAKYSLPRQMVSFRVFVHSQSKSNTWRLPTTNSLLPRWAKSRRLAPTTKQHPTL